MLSDKYIPYNDEWNYKIDLLNTLERIADSVAPIKVEEPMVMASIEETVETLKKTAKTRKKKGDV